MIKNKEYLSKWLSSHWFISKIGKRLIAAGFSACEEMFEKRMCKDCEHYYYGVCSNHITPVEQLHIPKDFACCYWQPIQQPTKNDIAEE